MLASEPAVIYRVTWMMLQIKMQQLKLYSNQKK